MIQKDISKEQLETEAKAMTEIDERNSRCEKEIQKNLEKSTSVRDFLKKTYKKIDWIGNGIAVVSDNHYAMGVVSINGDIIVPIGKYGWIDCFKYGLARVRTGKRTANKKNEKWGIIDETGKEIVPLVYDDIWEITDNYSTIILEKNGVRYCCDIKDPANVRLLSLKNDTYSDDENDGDSDYFTIDDCYDSEGNYDEDRLNDAIMDGEYVPEDW